MADNKAETQPAGVQVEVNLLPGKRGLWSRLGDHYKKWWWLHLIVLVVIVLVITLLVVYVAYPRIAQNDVNASTLNITQLVITDPTPDSFHVNQTQILGNKATYHPTIYAFNATISLVGATAPIAYALVPQIQANDGEVIHVAQTLQLSNPSAMADFSKAILNDEEVELNFYGRPDLKEGGLPTRVVTFNKTVTLKGLNGLKGFDITDVNILPTTDSNSDSLEMNGTVYIPNPSVLTVAMGNITLDLSVDGSYIGQSFLNDFTLVPGNNTLPMTSTVNQTQIIALLTGPYKNGVLPIDIRGNKSVYNGVEIPYFSEALASNQLAVNLNVTEAI
ncbi:hypothetical protein VTN77DRAFT_4102 [Rasamsonia byssochlamydoides]|uniref:uncharacterized protein n=1 Tax=Rasamsonia byssochlamydoides TaxID=89139 RepID=UPI0037435E6D